MLLSEKTAIVYGGSGALGGAAARVFAREGATVHLVGRREAALRELAAEIATAGGRVRWTSLDAFDEAAVRQHAAEVAAREGRIDVALNVVGVAHVQGVPLAGLGVAEFLHPVTRYAEVNFVTARAVAPYMAAAGSGVILTVSAPGSQLPGTGYLGNATACGAVEAFSRVLAGELGRDGIRVVCLRPNAVPASLGTSHLAPVFASAAALAGLELEEWLQRLAGGATLLGRLPTLEDFAEYAAMVASDRAGAMTAAIANLTCGTLAD